MSAQGPARPTLFKVYGALMGLLAVSAALTYAPLGSFHAAVSLLIAAGKAALVALFFMEVAYEAPAVWIWVAAGFYWLAILLVLSMGDYATRR